MQDSKFYGELGINANDIYIFEGEKVYGHELNYFFQGLIYKHFNMVKEDTWRLPTYWKAYNATADYLYEKINYGIKEPLKNLGIREDEIVFGWGDWQRPVNEVIPQPRGYTFPPPNDVYYWTKRGYQEYNDVFYNIPPIKRR